MQGFLQILERELMDTYTVNLEHCYIVGVTLFTPMLCIKILYRQIRTVQTVNSRKQSQL